MFKLIGITVGIALVLVAAPAGKEQILRIERMPESKIVHKVQPGYPPDALDRHIQGVVRIAVTIGKDGRTEGVRLISGHRLLAPAALQAAKRWVFQPSEVEGKPVRVVTHIEIPFTLN